MDSNKIPIFVDIQNMNNEVKICGVVVLYYPNPEELKQNIESYINHISKLYLICNSQFDPTSINQTTSHLYRKIEIIQNPKNYGVAKALNIAAERALNEKFDWILTMDQDSCFVDSTFFNQAQKYLHSQNLIIISPNQFETTKCRTPIRYNVPVITSGNLLNLVYWNKIGKFNEKLFIDEVDHEFCLRAMDKGYQILLFTQINLKHRLGEKLVKHSRLLKRRKTINSHSEIRLYYITRNRFYVLKKYIFKYPRHCLTGIYKLFKLYTDILLYEDSAFLKLRFSIIGFIHFLASKYGEKR